MLVGEGGRILPDVMVLRAGWLLACSGIGFGTASAAQDGKLERVREEVRSEDDDEPAHGPPDDDAWDDEWLDEGLFDHLIGRVIAFPFSAPRWILGDDSFAGCSFAAYPYALGAHGSGALLAPGFAGDAADDERLWSSRARLELGSDFDGLTRLGGRARVEHASRFGLEVELDRWSEELAGAPDDELWTGDAALLFRFAQGELGAFRLGAGVSWLDDDAGEDLGFLFRYGAELHPLRPFVLDAQLDLGRLGDATRVHARAALSVLFGRYELGLAYDAHEFGDAEFDSLSIGIGAWF